jgi:hypothetical protein
MKRLRIALLLAACSVMMGQGYNVPFSPPPSGATEIINEDFEVTTTGDCEEETGFAGSGPTSCAPDVCSDTAPVEGPDCGHTGISGSESMIANGQSHTGSVRAHWNFAGSCDSGICRAKFLMENDAVTGSTNDDGSRMYIDAGTTKACELAYDPLPSSLIQIQCPGGTSSTARNIVTGTVYKMCWEFDLDTDDCTLKVDPSGGTFCAGATYDDTVTDCTARTQIDEISLASFGDQTNTIFDDFVLENE